MNLAELDNLIKSLNPETDMALINFYKNKRKNLTKSVSDKINKTLKSQKLAKGSTINSEKGVNLFEDYDQIPKNLQIVLDKHEKSFEDGSYKGLAKALKEVNKLGYTFEYYLDGQAYDLRKIGQKGKSETEQYAKGSNITSFNYTIGGL